VPAALATPRRQRLIRARAERLFAAQVHAAIAALRRQVQVAPLARTIAERGPAAPLPEIPMQLFAARLQRELMRAFRDVYEETGVAVADALRLRLVRKEVSFATTVAGWGFDVLNPRALAFLAQHAAQHVTRITEETRAAMRTVLTDLHTQGVPAVQAARRIKDYIGLTEGHALAVETLRARLTELGAAPERVGALVARKVRELTEWRALTIARTEPAQAASAARRESWRQAADSDLFDRASAQRVWRTAQDAVVRDEHDAMEGVAVGLDEDFVLPDGRVTNPGEDINCRCDEDLVI